MKKLASSVCVPQDLQGLLDHQVFVDMHITHITCILHILHDMHITLKVSLILLFNKFKVGFCHFLFSTLLIESLSIGQRGRRGRTRVIVKEKHNEAKKENP